MPWEDLTSKTSFDYDGKLQFGQNEQFVVRLLDDNLPEVVFYHSCQNSQGFFVKVLCIGSKNGCKFCEANNTEENIKKKNQEKPWPFRSEFAKAVWVYQLNEMKLLIGKAVWEKQIKPLGVNYGTLADRDLTIMRHDTNGQVSYGAIPAPNASPFTMQAQINPQTIPQVAGYKEFLRQNQSKVTSKQSVVSAPAPTGTYVPAAQAPYAQPAPASTPVQAPPPMQAAPVAPATAPVSPVQTGAQALTPQQEAERQQLQLEFSTLMSNKFKSELVEEMMTKHAKGRQLEQMHPDEIRALIAEYKTRVSS